MFVKRVNDLGHTGWGVVLRWSRDDALAKWVYRFHVRGVHHPGSWCGFTLDVGHRIPGTFNLHYDWVVLAPTFCHQLVGYSSWLNFSGYYYDEHPTGDNKPWVTFDPVDTREFWKLAASIRREKDRGAADALLDWMQERMPPFFVGLLQEGVPHVRKVLAARQSQEVTDLGLHVGGDQRVGTV